MSHTIEVAELAQEASSPDEAAAVQEYVVSNTEMLQVTQEEVETFNQSLDDIETHANSASAYIAVAANEDAVGFLQAGVENANDHADNVSLSYDANQQWLAMGYSRQRNLTTIYLNGNNNFGIDLYVTSADVLAVGSESDFYLTGPTSQGYDCFMSQGDNCE